MMNNSGIYEAQKEEWLAEDPEGYTKFLWNQREKALKSYPEDEEIKVCAICGEPLVYRSMSYDEGFHFDSCL